MAKTLEQKLSKRSFGYTLLRNLLVGPALRLYYRKVDVIGAKTVPNTGPVIFAPNHPNALMDALLILCSKDRQPVFVARADIFKKPMIIAILNFLRILPIFRKRDGGIASDNNQETFDVILKTLQSGQAIGIMPEGTHNDTKRLRMLQKGVFRMAMQAQEEHGNAPMIKIIPVGLDYISTRKFRSDVMIRFGNAIEVSDFYDLYVENQARAFKQMQDVMMEKMREGMIDIVNKQYYSEIEFLRRLYLQQAAQRLGLDFHKAEHRLQTQQKTIAALQNYDQTNPDEMSKLCLAVRNYCAILEKHDIEEWMIESQPFSLAGLLGRSVLALLGIPFWILGMLFNYLPYKASGIASRKVKDPQFVSSVQFVTGIVIFPIYHFIMAVLFVIFMPCIWSKIIMPLLMIPLGIFSWNYLLAMKKLVARFRFRFCKQGKNPEIEKAIELRKNIFERLDQIDLCFDFIH